MKKRGLLLVAGALSVAAGTSSAAVLYSENFDTDQTANWTFSSSVSGDTANNNAGGEANVFFDYSTVGIPSAPGSGGTTRGLKMEANVPPGAAAFSGMSISPNGVSVTGDFTLQFYAWQNAPGPFPAGGAGSTQMTVAGHGGNPTAVQFPGGTPQDSVYFGGTGEGGSGVDYRAYLGNGGFTGSPPTLTTAAGSTQPDAQRNPDGTPVYAAGAAAGSTNNSHTYYAPLGSNSPPAAQTSSFPSQTGTTHTGTLGMTWREWNITKIGTRYTWSADGLLIATIDTTMDPGFSYSGDSIFFGHFDINSTQTTAALRPMLFGLIDNIVVSDVPEPGTLSLAALAGLSLRRRRRH